MSLNLSYEKIYYVFCYIVIVSLLIIIGCTKKDLSDSIIQKINEGKLNELNAKEKAYLENLNAKEFKGEKLTPSEARLSEELAKSIKNSYFSSR